jgi:hypothetical protein
MILGLGIKLPGKSSRVNSSEYKCLELRERTNPEELK